MVALGDTCVGAMTESIIPAPVMSYCGDRSWGIIEQLDNQGIPDILVGKVLTGLSKEAPLVPIRADNLSDEK